MKSNKVPGNHPLSVCLGPCMDFEGCIPHRIMESSPNMAEPKRENTHHKVVRGS